MTATGDGFALVTRGLFKRYNRTPAVDGLDLAVPRGVVYGFVGPNGAGKTTTMRLLVGLLRPDAGTMELLGQPYGWRDRRRLFRVGALIESPTFYPYLSGRDNLRVLAATGESPPSTRVDEVLDFVGMRDRARDKVNTYSLGMKQRLGIAATLLNDPELLLLDEPANGLDPGGIVSMRETMRRLTSTGKTVFISSHILPEVQQLADVIGIVHRGRIVKEGRLEDMLAEGGHVRVRVPVEQMNVAAGLLKSLAPDQPLYGVDAGPQAGWLTVRVAPARAAEVNRLLAGAGIFASAIESGNDLESVFLTLTRDAQPPPIGAVAAPPIVTS